MAKILNQRYVSVSAAEPLALKMDKDSSIEARRDHGCSRFTSFFFVDMFFI